MRALGILDQFGICIKAEGFIAKHPACCGSLIQGDVARSGEATDASIAEEPRMGLDLSSIIDESWVHSPGGRDIHVVC
jgi:hypothetical protein